MRVLLTVLFFLGIFLAPNPSSGQQKQSMFFDMGDTKNLVTKPWANPSELRAKKLIGAGQYSLQDLNNAVTPQFLAAHPEFSATHPFDGVTVVAPLDPAWCTTQGLEAGWNTTLDGLAWTRKAVPYSAIQTVIDDLNSITRGSLTDNFLWYRMFDGSDGLFTVDFTQDSDWAAVEQNAALSARICREANLKGFLLDTEMYSNYPNSSMLYPMGKDSPEVLRQRGAQWIKAVQAEYPAIKIMITFAWCQETTTTGWLGAGVKYFQWGRTPCAPTPHRSRM